MTDILSIPEAQVIADLAARANEAQNIDTTWGEDLVVLTTRNGDFEVIDMQRFSDGPRPSEPVAWRVYDPASFVRYLDRYSMPERTLICADKRTNQIRAILDYQNAELTGHGWQAHTVTLHLTPTDEWQAWERFSGVQMHRQDGFAEFVEEQLPVFVIPDGATMLEIAQSMRGTSTAQWQKATRLSNGETKFEFIEEVDAKAGRRGDIEIPQLVGLTLAPYEGSPRYNVEARLRYRVSRGELALGLALHRPQDIREKAFNAVLEQIVNAVHDDTTVIHGPIA